MFKNPQPNSVLKKPLKEKIAIEAILKSKLPPMPDSVMRISSMLLDENASNRKLSDELSRDPSLTARLLRLANSPINFLDRTVSSIQQAVGVVGTKSIYDIVTFNLVANSFSSEIRSSAIGRMIWEHSLVVGVYARELSNVLGMRGADQAFICGLLHDIGKIMLLRYDVETYSQVLDKQTESEVLEWETETFGYNHAQIGGLVVRGWNLPDDACQVVLNHHNPSHSTKSMFLTHLIDVADTVANIHGYGLRLEEETKLTESEGFFLLNIEQNKIDRAWENIQDNLREVLTAF